MSLICLFKPTEDIFFTIMRSIVSENQQPILILGTQYSIFELESLFGDSLHLFHSDETAIEGKSSECLIVHIIVINT